MDKLIANCEDPDRLQWVKCLQQNTKPFEYFVDGSKCVDKEDNCLQVYGEGVCNEQNKTWVSENCMMSCAMCSEIPVGMFINPF